MNTHDNLWIDIARTGNFTAGNGQQVLLTADCFDKLITGFDANMRRIPLVFGHPRDNAPAYGWVEGLRRMGNTLQAKFKQVHEDVKALVRSGHFKNVSISLSPDKASLYHVGLLGAVQPAIPGLREVSFAHSGGDLLVLEFSAPNEKEPDEQEAALEWLEEEIERLKNEAKQLRSQLEEQQEKLSAKDKEAKLARLKDTVDQGKVSPAEFALILPFATALLESESMLTFSHRPEPVHPLDAFTDILEARGQSHLFLNFSDFMTPLHSKDNEENTAKLKQKNPAYFI